ncbi:MAG: EutN/CcmL family microcompartment protein [Spirochaetales bacterium]|nr:EutN/CcmL family microcompartment protein [Spirochaetales bacterium]
MNFARVKGTVVSTVKLECFAGEKLLVLQPVDEKGKEVGQELVATDITRAGVGDLVFYETGREAAIALENTFNVSDATVMAIVDSVHREGKK